MPDYWLDSDVLIESKKRWYSFQIAPGFWAFLDQQVRRGAVAASSQVYHEIVDHSDDELAAWARERRGPPFFIDPAEAVQKTFTEVADYILHTYEDRHAQLFLSGADPWVIAHAKADGGSVVTLETRVDPSAKRVKIPNVCDHFEVACGNLFSMLEVLGMRL